MSSTTSPEKPSPSPVPIVFITGATGTQGFNLARRLSQPDLNWTVHATVRDPTSPAAVRLTALGSNIHIFPSPSWSDVPSLTTAMAHCTHLFLNTTPTLTDPSLEHHQTSIILSLAIATTTITHVVFSSALTIDRLLELSTTLLTPLSLTLETTILGQTLLSKAATESTLKSSPSLPHWTILRPASFMENYLLPKVAMHGPDLTAHRVWRMACQPTDTIPLVDTADIAEFAVAAFRDPGKFGGKEIGIAGEMLSVGEIAAELSRVIGELELEEGGEGGKGRGPIKYVAMGEEEVERERGRNPFVLGQLAVRELKRFVSVEESKGWGVRLGTFREFLEREREAVRETYCRGE